jgi:beta-glucosidase
MAHGAAVRALRSRLGQGAQVGFAPVGVVKSPASESKEDIAAAAAAMFEVGPRFNWTNAWYGDPVVFGRYPSDGLKHHEANLPRGWENDMASMRESLDFYGANIYNTEVVRATLGGGHETVLYPVGHPLTVFHWLVTPECLRWGPRFLNERYRLPIVITENGMSGMDWPQEDGAVLDPQRVDFLRRYLRELARGMAEGADVRGYFHWSLLDNFEWAEGYMQRFGLVHVDFATLKRTPKSSAAFYREVIRTRGANLST